MNDSHKRTSISQLLNPLGTNSQVESPPSPSRATGDTTSRSTDPPPDIQFGENEQEGSSEHGPGSSFPLRSASWEQSNGQSKRPGEVDPSRPYHYTPYSDGYNADPRGSNRPKDTPNGSQSSAWLAPHEVANMHYGPPVIAPLYSDERTGK